MKQVNRKWAVVLTIVILAVTSFRTSNGNKVGATSAGASPVGVHFKIAGKPYDVTVIRGLYDAKSKTFAIFNAGLPGFPQTTISLVIGSNFTGNTGTFKSAENSKGFVFGFMLFAGSINKVVVAFGAGQNDTSSGETVAGTPVSITLTSFSSEGTPGAATGNITAQGTFSGTVYDMQNKKTVALTDGTFYIHP